MSLEVAKICRTCLALDGILMSIYDSKNSSGSGCVADMLSDFTCIKPKKFDGMPEKICFACISEINRCYSFKMKCDNSDRTLRQLLDIPVESEPAPEPEPVTIHKSLQVEHILPKSEISSSPVEDKSPKPNVIILKQDIKASPIVETNLVLSVHSEEDIGTSFFTIQSDNEEIELHEDQSQTETIEDDNSGDYEIMVSKYVYETDTEVAQMIEEDVPEKQPKNKSVKEPKNELQCTMCPMAFVHPRNLNKHMAKYHENVQTVVDSQKTYKIDEVEDDTNEQQLSHELDQEVEYELQTLEEPVVKQEPIGQQNIEPHDKEDLRCPTCKAVFAKPASLNIHLKHNKCSVPQHPCSDCNKVFDSLKSLNAHIRTHDKFSCGTCGEKFNNKEDLAKHNKERHGVSLKYECENCKKAFTMRSTLKDHMRIHTGEKPFVCDLCGKRFTQNANLRQHVMRHNNTKPYKCDRCTRTFVSKGELYAHLRSHNGEHPFQCDVCPSAFTTSSSLVKHKRIHTGERPYACDFCPMRFTALNTLKNHRRVHTGERPYKCHYCDRSFIQKSDCSIHMRIHTGERKYVCSICNSSFQQSGTLRNHMKTHDRSRSSTKQTKKNVCEVAEEVEQPSTTVTEIDNDQEMQEEEENQQQQKKEIVSDDAMDIGEGDILDYAIEECSSGNSEFSGE